MTRKNKYRQRVKKQDDGTYKAEVWQNGKHGVGWGATEANAVAAAKIDMEEQK
jgi:hypothetical protein